jgi:hypothetical protein
MALGDSLKCGIEPGFILGGKQTFIADNCLLRFDCDIKARPSWSGPAT